MDHRFVGLPKDARGKTAKTYLYAANRKTRKRQVLWGDWLQVTSEQPDGWLEVLWSPTGTNPETLYIPKDHTTDERPLASYVAFEGQDNPDWQPQNTSVWPVQKFTWRDLTLRRRRRMLWS